MSKAATKQKYVYPKDIKPGGILSFSDADLMRTAIERAAELILDHGDAPVFSLFCGTVVCENDYTVEFVQTCTHDFPKADKDEFDFRFDLSVFGMSCTYIKAFGWNDFVEELNRIVESSDPLARYI
jgi:hypothetical protein